MKATNRKANRKRPAFRASLLAGACAVTTITGLAGTGVASASSTVNLQFWNAYNATDKEASTMANVVLPQFEKENPGIKVTSVVVPYSELLQKYIAAVAAGDPPAVMRSDIIWVPELASQGALLNLTHLGWFQPIKKDALPGPLSTNSYKGGYYGMPDDTNTQVLFWNKADFAAAGLSGPPTTLTQLFSDVPKLTNKAKGQFGLSVDGTDIWNISPYVWSSGGSFTNSGATTTSGFMNGGSTESTLGQLVGLYKAGDVGTDFLGGSGAISGETGFPKGQYAMYIDGPWAVPTYRQDKFSGYGLSLFPKGSAGSVSVVGGEDLVMATNVQHQADAVKLAQFLTSPFAQLQMANQGDLATYKSDSAPEIKAQPYLGTFVQQLGTAEARPVSPVYTRIDTDFSNELQEAVAGKLPLDNALNAASGQANAAIRGELIATNTLERRPAATSPGVASRRSPRSYRARKLATPYLLLLPALLVYVVFTVYPIFRQFEISFFNWHIFPGASNPFIGFSNFTQIFHDPVVRTAAFNSFLYIVITVPVQMAIGLFAAAILTDRLPGGILWRAAVYIPVVTSWVVVSFIFAYIFSSEGGIMNAVAGFFTGHTETIPWTAQTWTGNVVIWLIGIWKGIGWSFIIFLAALDGVPRPLLESARIDGATEPRVWRYVVLPSIRPAVIFVLVLLVIGAAQVFTQIYLVTLGGPYNSTQALMPYMYMLAFKDFEFGYAAAMASLLALVLFGFSVAEIRILRQDV